MRWEKIVGDNVRRLRQAQSLSQETLAAKSGIDMRYLGGIERAQENPSLAVICDIASVLGVHPSTLLIEPKSKT